MLNLTPFTKALGQLEKSLAYVSSDMAKQDPALRQQLKMAAIQAFEYTYELSHKFLKRYLEMVEPSPDMLDEMPFPDLIRTGYERGVLKNSWSVWEDFRKSRGTTSHAYDEEKAEKVFIAIPAFLAEARFLHDTIKSRL